MAKKGKRKNIGNQGDLGRRAKRLGQDRDAAMAAAAGYETAIPDKDGIIHREVINRENLHPSLRHLAEDDEIAIIITTGGDEPPPGAGELLGELSRGLVGNDGRRLPEGSKVWADVRQGSLEERARARGIDAEPQTVFVSEPGTTHREAMSGARKQAAQSDVRIPRDAPFNLGAAGRPGELAPPLAAGPAAVPAAGDVIQSAARAAAADSIEAAGGPVPAAFRRRAELTGHPAVRVAQALEDEQEGLTAKLARGLSAEELTELAPAIAKAAAAGGMPSGAAMTFTDEEGGETLIIEGVPDTEPARIIIGAPGAEPARLVGGSPGTLPGGLRPGDIIAEHQPFGYEDAGVPVPEGAGHPGDRVWRPRPRLDLDPEAAMAKAGPASRAALAAAGHEAGEPTVISLTAAEVLEIHTQQAALAARPTPEILRYIGRFIQNTVREGHEEGGTEQAREYWNGMFAPARNARDWCSILSRLLSQGRTYQITAEMVTKVTDQYNADLASGSYLIEEDDPPWPAGFAWLDHPLVFTDKFGRTGWNRAIAWGPEYHPRSEYGSWTGSGARIVSWSWYDDRDSYWTEDSAAAMLRDGGLSIAFTTTFPFGGRLDVTRGAHGLPTQDDMVRWTRTLWRVLSSEISATARVHDDIPVPVRWRARKSLRHTEVHVVTLRRRHSIRDGEPGLPGFREWTCRWPVDAFWRHARRDQDWEEAHKEYDENGRRTRHHAVPDEARERCAICGAKVSYLETFIKGPKGLPLRDQNHRTLYRLSR